MALDSNNSSDITSPADDLDRVTPNPNLNGKLFGDSIETVGFVRQLQNDGSYLPPFVIAGDSDKSTLSGSIEDLAKNQKIVLMSNLNNIDAIRDLQNNKVNKIIVSGSDDSSWNDPDIVVRGDGTIVVRHNPDKNQRQELTIKILPGSRDIQNENANEIIDYLANRYMTDEKGTLHGEIVGINNLLKPIGRETIHANPRESECQRQAEDMNRAIVNICENSRGRAMYFGLTSDGHNGCAASVSNILNTALGKKYGFHIHETIVDNLAGRLKQLGWTATDKPAPGAVAIFYRNGEGQHVGICADKAGWVYANSSKTLVLAENPTKAVRPDCAVYYLHPPDRLST